MISLDIVVKFDNPVEPAFLEALFRGGLGFVIKKLVCIKRGVPDCKECLLTDNCLYSIMYNEQAKTKNGLQVSSFGLYCHHLGPDAETFIIKLNLYEPLIQYYPHLVAIFHQAGKMGIGKKRNTFNILGFYDHFNNVELYDENKINKFNPIIKEWDPEFQADLFCSRCSIEFLSPARIQRKGDLKNSLDFHEIIKSCAMRFLNMSRAFNEKSSQVALVAKDIIEESKKIETCISDFNWVKRERYSMKQHSKISAGGFTGEIFFKGNSAPFTNLLEFGSIVGIGKNTTFGCGRYKYYME